MKLAGVILGVAEDFGLRSMADKLSGICLARAARGSADCT